MPAEKFVTQFVREAGFTPPPPPARIVITSPPPMTGGDRMFFSNEKFSP